MIVKSTVLIHCGVAVTRAGVLADGVLRRLYVGPARGDEADDEAPQLGDKFFGRVRLVDKTLSGAFVDIGAAAEAFLPLKGAPKAAKPPAEGALVAVQVRRPAIAGKGAVVALADPSGDGARAPGRMAPPADAATAPLLLADFQGADEIICDAAAAIHPIEAAATAGDQQPPKISVDIDAVREAGLGDAVDAALEAVEPIAGGARMIFAETAGGCVVDIDAGGAGFAGGGGHKANDRVNTAAAKALAGALGRRGIGGGVVVDFLPPSSRAARDRLLSLLRDEGHAAGGARLGPLSDGGVAVLSRPRLTRSLLEQASEPAGDGWARMGRRLTTRWQAAHAIDALEAVLARRPRATPQLFVGRALASFIEDKPHWPARLAERYGARFKIDQNTALEARSYDVAE